MSKFTQIIGKRISDRRTDLDLSQQELADLAKIQVAYLGRVELGKYNDLGIKNLRKICKALDIKMVDLFKGY